MDSQLSALEENDGSQSPPKSALGFILDCNSLHLSTDASVLCEAVEGCPRRRRLKPKTTEAVTTQQNTNKIETEFPRRKLRSQGKVKRVQTIEEKRQARACSIEGCTNYTIDRKLCFRHGGGKKCSVEGCNSSVKHRGLCWRHGGSTECTVEGCTRGAKAKGLCWSHGGGSKCTVENCEKTVISKGRCWAHGGGKRCTFANCKRPASKSTHNLCSKHQTVEMMYTPDGQTKVDTVMSSDESSRGT